jgi:hypothetical protein
MDQTLTLLFFFAAILIVAGILFAVIALTKRDPKGVDVEAYRSRWLEIEKRLQRDQTATYHLCVMNADTLLAKALQDRGVKGETMAERLKQYQGSWTNTEAVWGAHKLRNRIAHETDVQVSYDETRRALGAFKQALKDVGAI